MKIGMIWYDSSKEEFSTKCNRAIAYYETKYGIRPTAIWVHPNTATADIPGVTITKSISILPNHFWVGQNE